MTKPFKPTYLYIKTHNTTGLKYFGKTTSNRQRYRGSGKYWISHIKKHGYDVTTEIVGYFTDEISCMLYALEFSYMNDIVNSAEWANYQPESGIDGGDTISYKTDEERTATNEKRRITFSKMSAEEKEKIRAKNSSGVKKYIAEHLDEHKERSANTVAKRKASGMPWHSEVTKENISRTNKSGTDEVKQKISQALTGRKNPKHSEFMSGRFVGKDNRNTRVFTVVDPGGSINDIVGCVALGEFCIENNLAYARMLKHINTGKITQTSTKGPTKVKNCVGYEITESKK